MNINLRRVVTPKTVFILVVAIVIIAFFGKNVKDIMLVAFLAAVASFSTIYKRIIRVPSAVELVTLGTVITGAAYGPVIGAVFGVVTTFAAQIISGGIDVFTIFYAVARVLAVMAVFLLIDSVSIVTLGMISAVTFNVLCLPIYWLSGDVEVKVNGVIYFVVNILFNFIVFAFFGGFLLKLARL